MTTPRRKAVKKKKAERLSLHPLNPADALRKMLGTPADKPPQDMVPQPKVEVGTARTQKTRKNLNGRRS